MKKIYITFLTIAAALNAGAQLTQGNNAPANGEQYSTYQCDTIGPGASGGGSNWNFAVTTHSSILNNYTVTALNNPNYPGANIAVTSGVSNSAYFGSNSASLLYYGGNISVGQLQATLNYSMPAIYASYPMSLNTTSTTAITGSMNITSPLATTGNFAGTSTATADGTGTLTLAGETYTGVTRVRVSQSFNFTTSIAQGSVIQDAYRFFISGVKGPVLTIETSTATTPLGTNTQTIVARMKSVPSQTTGSTVGLITFVQSEGMVSVFPNPANTEVRMESSVSGAVSVSVFDLTGKLLEEKQLHAGNLLLDVEGYSKGLYIYRVNAADGSVLHTGKFTVVH